MNNILNEIVWSDIHSPNFKNFRKKYLKTIKDGSGYSLYVNFTNHGGFDTLARSYNPNSSHSDPVGVYAYPLRYVVNYPADIWYGSRAKYLRVLKILAPYNKVLNLSNLTYNNAINILQKMGMQNCDRLMEIAKKLYDKKNIGSAFFAVVQLKIENVPYKRSYKWSYDLRNEVEMRTGQEQAALLKRAGFWVVEDEAKSANVAAINQREPKQICFLVPQAFRVIEVYNLTGKGLENMATNQIQRFQQRKIASLIANLLNDQLSGESELSKFWTKKGRRIDVEALIDTEAAKERGYRIGFKKHKGSKLHDFHKINITISCEWGNFWYTIDKNESIKDGIADIIHDLINQSKKEPMKDWTPETKSSFKEKEIKARMVWYKSQEKKVIEGEKNQNSIINDLNEIANILNTNGYDTEESFTYKKDIAYAVNILRLIVKSMGIPQEAPRVNVSYEYSYENNPKLWYPRLKNIIEKSFEKINIDQFKYNFPWMGDSTFSNGAWWLSALKNKLKEL